MKLRKLVVPDTVQELFEQANVQRGVDAIFWALTDDDEVVASELFKLWKGQGNVFAQVHAYGRASKYRVVSEALDLDYSAQWDDGVPVDVEPGDAIKFTFTLRTEMIYPG
mgnify:CR=1 FL=1